MPGKCVRGSVIDVNLDPSVGREMMKTRPCVVIQNDIGNARSQVTIVVAITGAENVARLYPIFVPVPKGQGGLSKDSVVLCNQIRTVDESRLGALRGELSPEIMRKVDEALKISLALD